MKVAYLERERNYLPWTIAIQAFRLILDLLEPRDTDVDTDYHEAGSDYHEGHDLIDDHTRGEVRERFKDWVINLMMPYFYDNGYNDNENATEEERHLKEKMKDFACERLNPGLQNLICFTQSKSFESNFTLKKARKSRQIEHLN